MWRRLAVVRSALPPVTSRWYLRAVPETMTDIALRPHLGDPGLLSALLSADGVVRTGHFRLLSGQHTDRFLAFSEIASESQQLDLIASWLGPTVDAWAPNVVLAPSTAGVGLAATLARRLSAPLHLASAGPDGRPETVIGVGLPPGGRVLLVNDVTTTGTALNVLADLARRANCQVVGGAWFVSRAATAVRDALTYPTVCVGDLDLPSWPAAECALCGKDLVIEDARDLN